MGSPKGIPFHNSHPVITQAPRLVSPLSMPFPRMGVCSIASPHGVDSPCYLTPGGAGSWPGCMERPLFDNDVPLYPTQPNAWSFRPLLSTSTRLGLDANASQVDGLRSRFYFYATLNRSVGTCVYPLTWPSGSGYSVMLYELCCSGWAPGPRRKPFFRLARSICSLSNPAASGVHYDDRWVSAG